MSIVNAVAGEVVNASVRFTDEDGNPILNAQNPVSYRILDPSLRLVLTDVAIQDTVDASLFTATFTLPSSLPASEQGQQYSIRWSMKTVNRASFSSSEQFSVTRRGDDTDSFYPKDVVIVPGMGFIDRIKIRNSTNLPNVVYSIIDEAGRILSTQTIATPDVSSTNYAVYTASFTATQAQALGIPLGVQQHYMGNWYLTGGSLEQPEIESHPIYVMTPQLQTIVHAVYKMLADGILENVDPYVTWTAGQFAHHAIKGFEWVNSIGLRITGFTIYNGLPVGLTQYIEKAAMVSALRAQMFAYQSGWDFQGAGVQLNVDRNSAISDLLGQLTSDLDKAADAKKSWLNSGRPTTNAVAAQTSPTPMVSNQISIGPSTVYAAPHVPFEAVVPSYLMINGLGGPRGGRRL